MSAIFGKQLFQQTCCVTALLSCVCKVIQYAVLTMHILKIPLGFFKKSLNVQYFLRFSYENFFERKKKSAAMPLGSEALLSELLVQTHF